MASMVSELLTVIAVPLGMGVPFVIVGVVLLVV